MGGGGGGTTISGHQICSILILDIGVLCRIANRLFRVAYAFGITTFSI